MHRFFTLLLLGFTLLSFGQSIEQKAANIHDRVFTIDSHTDTPLKFFNSDLILVKSI